MPFALPTIHDNPDGWGPSNLPDRFTDQPYAPFNKGDRLGKAADWSGNPNFQNRGMNRGRGSGVINDNFTYHADMDDSFHLVDNVQTKPQGWGGGRGRGRGKGGKGGRWNSNFQQNRGNYSQNPKQNLGKAAKHLQPVQTRWQKSRNNTFNRWQDRQPQRIRESSVDVRPGWTVLEQINFSALSKLVFSVDEPEDLLTCGTMEYYDRLFDRVTPKTPKTLDRVCVENKTFFKVTTSDDPIIRDFAEKDESITVFATDTILSVLMAAPRSAFSWDIVVNRIGNKLYLDKRDDAQFDYVTCNETAHEQADEDKDSINSAGKLSQEGTFVNQTFSIQSLIGANDSKLPPYKMQQPNSPFATDGVVPAPVGYRYRKWDLGDGVVMLARCELDGVAKGKEGEDLFISLKALNEVDSKLFNTIDWRQKLDSQRGAVLATELKNNSNKLAKWTLQALMAGADLMKLGYISRLHPKDAFNHEILGVQGYKPKEFATQINLNVPNAWGILRAIIDLCLKLDEGKYLLLKDPNKPLVRLYEIPHDAFDEAVEVEEEEGAKGDDDSEED